MDAGCAVLFLAVYHIAACDSSGIILRPAEDTIIASNSPDNITYTCERRPAKDVRLRWAVRGEQIWSESQVEKFARNGVFAENQGSPLSLVITPEGRQNLEAHLTPISIKCSSFYTNELKRDATSEELEIVQFDAPGSVVGLQLTYMHVSDPETELRLQWDRPKDTHEDVNIIYDVTMDNITLAQTSMTHVSVSQNIEEMCQQHVFAVSARNSAGRGPLSDIMESIPISPDVDALNVLLKVLLINNTDVNISLSFQHATVCNDDFPVLNYTLNVGGRPVAELIASDYTEDTVSVTISSLEIPTLTLGQQYGVVITACIEFTCRSSKTPLAVVTGDVQTASVIFYMTSVMVECTLAEGSTASGCLLVFTRFSDNGTENVTDRYPTGVCPQMTQTRGAYAEEILVYALASDNSTVVQPVMASVIDATDTNNFTCVLAIEPTKPQSEESKANDLGTGGIVGIVVGALMIILILVIILAVGFYKNKTNKDSTDIGIPLQESYIHIGVVRRQSNDDIEVVYDNIQQVEDNVMQGKERPIFWKNNEN